MRKEIEVKNTDTVMNPHWNGQITLSKEMGSEPLMMEQTNAITIVEAPKELDSVSFMGITTKTEHIGIAVLAVLVLIIGFRWCTGTLGKPVRRDSKGRRL